MEDINFDLVRTVQVIQMDEDLTAMFVKKFPEANFDSVLEAAKKGVLDNESVKYAEGIYNSIILSKKVLKELYVRNLVAVSTPKSEVKEKKARVKKLPKEYNKIRIDADVKENGGVATEFHKAMLALSNMKNIRARLNAKGNRQRYADGKPFTDAECREILAVVQIIENRLGKIK